jgi:hypothetical protein
MRALKRIAIAIAVYVAIVVTFESLIGFFQPAGEGTLVITTTDESGGRHDRVVSGLESQGQLYVAANHWPRAWYEQALQRPEVEVRLNGERSARLAVPVTGEEHDRVEAEHRHGLAFRFLTGFPPRYFLRLAPR